MILGNILVSSELERLSMSSTYHEFVLILNLGLVAILGVVHLRREQVLGVVGVAHFHLVVENWAVHCSC